MKLLLTLAIISVSIFALSITPIFAQETNWLDAIGVKDGTFIPVGCTDSDQFAKTPCGLNEAFQTIINFTQILMAMTGSVMILMFIYGGTMMIIAGAPFSGKGDNRKTINQGKDAIMAAIVGLIIILGAWLAINFTILALTEGKVGGTAKLFNRPFNEAAPISENNQNLSDEDLEELINALPGL